MSASLAELENDGSPLAEWVVCAGVTRDVDVGRVRCPQRGHVDLSRCLDCPYLETLDGERARPGCATPDA